MDMPLSSLALAAGPSPMARRFRRCSRNSRQPTRVAAWLLSAALGFAVAANADTPLQRPATDEGNAHLLQALVSDRLAFYGRAFPEIQFVQLPGGSQWRESARTFEWLLGEAATNADYEHPPELGAALLYASVQRILHMLEQNEASSALFRVGVGSAGAQRSHLCVLTLDASAVAGDDATATAHLLNFAPEDLDRIPAAYRLQHREFLRFVVDHEVFHCLDAMYVGPIPMSDHAFWAQYMLYRNEHGADAFAIAMHLREHSGTTGFVDKLARIRALSLYNADPEHLTTSAIAAAARHEGTRLRRASPRDVLVLADRVRDQVVTGYGGYLRFRAAACRVMADIGTLAREDGPLCAAARAADQAHRALRDSTDRALGELFQSARRSRYDPS